MVSMFPFVSASVEANNGVFRVGHHQAPDAPLPLAGRLEAEQ
jgi:hypothetical protein